MTGPRETGVLLGQAQARTARRQTGLNSESIAIQRIAEALEGIEVSLAAMADMVEAQAYLEPYELDEETDTAGCA